jgi:hypothetical protein
VPDFPIITRYLGEIPTGVTGNHFVADTTGQEWVLKPAIRPDSLAGRQPNYRCLLSEIVAVRFFEKLGLTMPRHSPIYLPGVLIASEQRLSSLTEGYHLGVERLQGVYTLGQITGMRVIRARVASRITNMDEAPGIVTGDTWLANWDHAWGSERAQDNPGNLLFQQDGKGTSEQWTMWTIDMGHAFDVQNWGVASTDRWPCHARGTVKIFFEEGWIPDSYTGNESTFDLWITEIEAMDLPIILEEILVLQLHMMIKSSVVGTLCSCLMPSPPERPGQNRLRRRWMSP